MFIFMPIDLICVDLDQRSFFLQWAVVNGEIQNWMESQDWDRVSSPTGNTYVVNIPHPQWEAWGAAWKGGGENVRAGGWGECWEMLSSAHTVTISLRNSWPKIKGLKFWHNTVDNLQVPPPIGESWQLITVMVSYRTAGWTWILSIVSASLHWSISGRWHLILWMFFLLPIKWGD